MAIIYRLNLWLKKNLLVYKVTNYIKGRHIRALYKKVCTSSTAGERTVIYMADGLIKHGGLCDRIWGMVSAYNYFKKTKLSYKIHFCHPYHLTEYLLPNRYDWKYSGGIIRSAKFSKSFYVGDTLNETNVLNAFSNICKRQFMQSHLYTNVHIYRDEFSRSFNELFKPSEALTHEIEHQLQSIGDKYISVSFRFRNAFGDLNEPDSLPLRQEQQRKLTEECLKCIKNIHNLHPGYKKILLTCDSKIFIERAKDLDYIYVIPGEISHVDFDQKELFRSQLKTFLDLFMLSKSEEIYYVVSNLTYHGSFAYTASLIGNRPYHIEQIQI